MGDTNTVLNVNRLIGCTNKLSRRINRVNRKIKKNSNNTKDIDYINDFLVNTFQEDGNFIVSPYIDINDKTLGNILDNELSRTHNVLEQKLNKENAYLRIGVKGGGCSGFNYVLDLNDKDKVNEEDELIFSEKEVKIICDEKSHLYIDGVTIDYIDAVIGQGFVFNNPNATSTCGCGSSFSA